MSSGPASVVQPMDTASDHRGTEASEREQNTIASSIAHDQGIAEISIHTHERHEPSEATEEIGTIDDKTYEEVETIKESQEKQTNNTSSTDPTTKNKESRTCNMYEMWQICSSKNFKI